jgi:S1-C subfamily serine protease
MKFAAVSLLFWGLLFCNRQPEESVSPHALERAKARYATIYLEKRPVGSGYILDKKGRVLTCLHTVKLAGKLPVLAKYDEVLIGMQLLSSEPAFDLAILSPGPQQSEMLAQSQSERSISEKLSLKQFPDFPDFSDFTPRESLRPGQISFMVAAPFGLETSLLVGAIAHTDRRKMDPLFPDIPFIQASRLAYPGTSGAAVFDQTGRFIGLMRSEYGFAPDSGIGFIIPSGFVRVFLEKNQSLF